MTGVAGRNCHSQKKPDINVDSYRNKTVTYPSPRCDEAPGSHEWLWRHLHVARSPGSCRHLQEVRSGALESYNQCGHFGVLLLDQKCR